MRLSEPVLRAPAEQAKSPRRFVRNRQHAPFFRSRLDVPVTHKAVELSLHKPTLRTPHRSRQLMVVEGLIRHAASGRIQGAVNHPRGGKEAPSRARSIASFAKSNSDSDHALLISSTASPGKNS